MKPHNNTFPPLVSSLKTIPAENRTLISRYGATLAHISLTISISCFIFSGCAGNTLLPQRIKNQNTRFDFQGASLLPPKGKNWYLIKNDSKAIAFAKRANTPTHTYVCAVFSGSISPSWKNQNDFIEFVKQQKKLDSSMIRFKTLEESYVLDTKFGPYSLKYHITAEDHGPNNNNDPSFLVVDIYGYFLMHPVFIDRFLDVQCSERFMPGDSNRDLTTVSEDFFKNFRLTDQILLPKQSFLHTLNSKLYYGFLPGTDYKIYRPNKDIDLKGKTFDIIFEDNRDKILGLNYTGLDLDRETELEGDSGMSLFQEYIISMIQGSNGKLDAKSQNKITIRLEELTSELAGFGYIVAHGIVKFRASSSFLNKTYYSDMTDRDKDAPLKWYSLVTRKTASRLIVSGSIRRAVENFVKELASMDLK